jgi:hypothetical protein
MILSWELTDIERENMSVLSEETQTKIIESALRTAMDQIIIVTKKEIELSVSGCMRYKGREETAIIRSLQINYN